MIYIILLNVVKHIKLKEMIIIKKTKKIMVKMIKIKIEKNIWKEK